MKIRKIVTHEYPDLDAVTSIWLLRNFGDEHFSGIQSAELEFVPAQHHFDQSNCGNDVIAVDIHGGHFDHHHIVDATKCAAVLVAEQLGVRKDPALAKILLCVNRQDLTGKVRACYALCCSL